MSSYSARMLEKVVGHIRKAGPLSAAGVSDALKISRITANDVIRAARGERLVMVVGKDARKSFIFGAVQTADWPGQP